MNNLDPRDEMIEFLVGVYNDVFFELGVAEGTQLNVTNIRNIFNCQPPQELQKRLMRLPE